MNSEYSFKNGTYVFHKNPTFNFQLNRTLLWGEVTLLKFKRQEK